MIRKTSKDESYEVRVEPHSNFATLYVSRNGLIPMKKDFSVRPVIVGNDFVKNVDRILDFEGRNDDTYVVTFTKSGTTWMQETAWLVLNDFDFQTASSTVLMKRSPYLEFNTNNERLETIFNTLELLKELKSPRLIKSHLPASALPSDLWNKKNKVIYVTRNMKDALVSAFHFYNGLGDMDVSIEKFAEMFMKNEMPFLPYWDHTLEFWEIRNQPNIYFTSYERMSKDIKSILKDLCIFLGKPIPSDDILKQAEEHLSFNNMKNAKAGKLQQDYLDRIKSLNGVSNSSFQFMRKGVTGSSKEDLSDELAKRLDEWEELHLKSFGITKKELYGI